MLNPQIGFSAVCDSANLGPHATEMRATAAAKGDALSPWAGAGGRDLGVALFVTNRTFCSRWRRRGRRSRVRIAQDGGQRACHGCC